MLSPYLANENIQMLLVLDGCVDGHTIDYGRVSILLLLAV
jgi:hypothetical protein